MSYERESVKALEIGIHVAWRSEFSGSRSSWAQLVFITVYSAKMCINPVFRKVGLSQKIRRSGKKFPDNKKVNLGVVRTNVLEYIQKEHPELDESKNIALSELYEYRGKYMEQSLREEFNNLSQVEKEILEKMKNNDTVSIDLENDLKDRSKDCRSSSLVRRKLEIYYIIFYSDNNMDEFEYHTIIV